MQYIFYFLNKFTNQRIGIPTTITTIATIKKTKSAIVIATKPKNRLYSLTLITLSIEAFKSREFMSLFRFIFQHLIYFAAPLAPLRLPPVSLNKVRLLIAVWKAVFLGLVFLLSITFLGTSLKKRTYLRRQK